MSTFRAVDISLIEEKHHLRRGIRQAASALSLGAKFDASMRIYGNLFSLPEFRRAKKIHAYLNSFQWEVPTISLVGNNLNKKGVIIIPVACPDDTELRHFPLNNLARLKRGRFKTWEPPFLHSEYDSLEDIDLILIPGMAFDRARNRLGFGRGYYDKFLPKMNQPKVALAYAFQLFDRIPSEDFDHKVDIIVSEFEVIRK